MSTCQDSLRLKASRPRHSSSVRLRSRVASMASCGKRLSQNGSFSEGWTEFLLQTGFEFLWGTDVCFGKLFPSGWYLRLGELQSASSWYLHMNSHPDVKELHPRHSMTSLPSGHLCSDTLLWELRSCSLICSRHLRCFQGATDIIPTHSLFLIKFSQWIFTNQFAPQFLPIHVHKIEFPKSFRLSHSPTSKRCCAVRGVPCRVLLWGPGLQQKTVWGYQKWRMFWRMIHWRMPLYACVCPENLQRCLRKRLFGGKIDLN